MPIKNRGRVRLFDYLNGSVWTLYLAGSASKALVRVFNGGLLLNYLKNFHGTDVNAGSASITFVFVDFNLDHELIDPPRDDLESNEVIYER